MKDVPVIFITGSSRGIGAATARLAKAQGWQPILHGRTETEQLKQLSAELNALIFVADVSDKTAIQSVIKDAYSKYNRLDALVNCAGIVKPKPFLEMEETDWQEEYKVNVMGTIFSCQTAIPIMQQQDNGGRIVNVSSIRGLSPTTSERGISYSISKSAIVTLTETLAKAFAPKIAVNAVAPGFTGTEMSEKWNETVRNQAMSALMKRIAHPSEIASAIMFLASPEASFITGQTLLVDGGYTIAGK